ncbi:hypothetical protein NUW58_g5111 [Xylaria curta]|uniref:Uncharacterized protein n=1 Tax=Xylaria curta TaxID=42375 RepID=A0ACC1P5R5_9PEZI|nr:hypothetical protein NUW58_g5111 [Xylaria curta]
MAGALHARREEAREEQSDEGILPPVNEPAALESGAEKIAITPSLNGNAENDKAEEENGNGDVDMSGDQDAIPFYKDLKPSCLESTSGQKNKKKRKKKKKSKSKEAELE